MSRKFIFCFVFLFIAGFAFAQTSALRDYVGMISQGFHPDIVSFLQKLKTELDRKGYNNFARGLEVFLKGESGTGFVYSGSDGKNYILTNYHVISQAYTLSITFETLDGEKTKFSDLQIVAADEEMDIALLAFAGGQNPFKQGLSLLNRPVQEGEDVYSAGFPLTGSALIWQLGRGIVSNASVRLPPEDENDKAIGPYIQHTAQIDPGNSGGPLLVQARGVPTGYAVAGINTLSIRRRQAANYSIPLNRVQAFLDLSLKPRAANQLPILEERVNAFIKGLSAPRAVYPHIAQFLSNTCIGENAEYALSELLDKASRTVRDNVFDRDIISCMAYSVAWTIENSLRSKTGSISIKLNSINPGENGSYNVSFDVAGANIDSVWINEYGIWRIRSFGTSASGDKTLIDKKKQAKTNAARLHDNPSIMLSAGLAYPLDLGAAFGADLTIKFGKYFGMGPRAYFGKDYTQVEMGLGPYVPIKIGSMALTPFVNMGIGAMFILNPDYIPSSWYNDSEEETLMPMGVSIRGGFCFTMSAVPGLFLQGTYQRNLYTILGDKDKSFYPDLIYIGIGYAW
ncbi:MAG: serine protease [Treponema sp.]|jgi:serine protease Do|nr:serine protease [Treponema sp.]